MSVSSSILSLSSSALLLNSLKYSWLEKHKNEKGIHKEKTQEEAPGATTKEKQEGKGKEEGSEEVGLEGAGQEGRANNWARKWADWNETFRWSQHKTIFWGEGEAQRGLIVIAWRRRKMECASSFVDMNEDEVEEVAFGTFRSFCFCLIWITAVLIPYKSGIGKRVVRGSSSRPICWFHVRTFHSLALTKFDLLTV